MPRSTGSLRFRYSLRAFFIVTTLACAGLYHWHISSRLDRAEAELRRLRDETGRLTLKNRDQVHAVSVETGEPNTWRWRLFVPKGNRYMWHVASHDIPFKHPPKRAGSSGVTNAEYWKRDNEVLVTARLRETDSGDWTLSVRSKIGGSEDQMGGASMSIEAEELDWLASNPSHQMEILGKKSTETVDPTQPIVLLTKRPMKLLDDGFRDFHREPCPGLMVWLAPH